MEVSQLKSKKACFGKPGGFTLAELLIALAILGVIATFTIPKILSAQQASANVAEAKEVAAVVSEAYQKAQADGVVTASTKPADLTPYINYVDYDTSSGTIVDAHPASSVATVSCSNTTPCIKLHNGGILWLEQCSFGGTSTLNAIDFRFDPDPANYSSSTADGPLKAVRFTLYYNGFITTRGKAKAGTFNSCFVFSLNPAFDPSWFTWN